MMINVKDQVYAALCAVTENVMDVYPQTWATLPAIQYTEEDNSVYTRTDADEQYANLRYRIDIWDTKSTSLTALAVDEAVSELGLIRTACQDVADPSGLRHKVMRYEGIIDVNTQMVYWNGSR